MLVSFPMDNATEKRSNLSHGTSERAQHEGLFGSKEDSRDNSRENALLSKCNCSDRIYLQGKRSTMPYRSWRQGDISMFASILVLTLRHSDLTSIRH